MIASSAGVAILMVACGGKAESGSPAGPSTSTEAADENPPRPEDRCPGGKTRPFDLQTVIEVARRHGITLYSQPNCLSDARIRTQAANILQYGPDRNDEQQSEIERREGRVTCLLRATPGQAPKVVERNRYVGDAETHFSLLNVVCVIYPDPDDAEEQLARLQEAMDELQLRSRAPS